MTNHENGRPPYANRLTDFFDDDIADDCFGNDIIDIAEETIGVPASFHAEVSHLHKWTKELACENAQLRETIRTMDRDIRAREIDINTARAKVARQFAAKLKRLWKGATQ